MYFERTLIASRQLDGLNHPVPQPKPNQTRNSKGIMNKKKGPKLFTSAQLGSLKLKHRVVMAPLTRSRSEQPGGVPGDMMVRYYSDRASNGGLIISEATNISLTSRGWYGAPGLYTDQQVNGWKRVVSAIHAKSGFVFAQLWHTGRASQCDNQEGNTPVSASVDPTYWEDPTRFVSARSGWVHPSPHRALDISEIPGIIEDYRKAAVHAKAAGFDGVELHAANGYLPDQFLQDGSNKRTDAYGGSIDNRSRFLLEVVEALTSVWGGERVGVRIAPAGTWNHMCDSNPGALFIYVAQQLNRFGLAYLHIVEPRVKGNTTIKPEEGPIAAEQLRKVFKGKIIAAGGFEPDTAEATIESDIADAVAFGRHFVANPDLPLRIQKGLALTSYDRDTFYTFESKGYNDYPFANDSVPR
jgi:N-ethylmaleimide reductase